MFGKKKIKKTFDRSLKRPILHISICTGEKVAGFKNLENGKFEDIMLIRSEEDLNFFLQEYGIQKEEMGKEW